MSDSSSDHRWISFRHSKLDDEEHDLDAFLGHLYDDMNSKVRASHMIFLMSVDIDRLGAIASHRSAMGALARVLREEGRKSFELRLNTVSTFLIFSFFQTFHQILIENQIGRATLSLLNFENLRTHNLPNCSVKTQARTEQVMEDSKDAEEEKIFPSINLSINRPAWHDQEKLLYISVHLLYNIAEDVQIEKKMRKCNLVNCLCEVLHRTNTLLLIIVVAFLKKLSVYKENLDAMRESAVIFKLLHILHFKDESLLCGTLRLLWNLSFDRGFREEMVDSGFLQILEALLRQKKFEHLVSRLLYNLSRDLDLRLKISESKVLSILVEPILAEHDIGALQELSALAINLTCIPKTTMLNLDSLELEKFVAFVLRTNDVFLFKVVKNLSFLERIGSQLIPFLPALVASLLRCEPCIQVEVMGTLNNLTCIEELRDSLLLDAGLLHYLSAHLHVSNTEDDINLQIIMFIGGVCSHVSAPTISQVGLVSNLCDVFVHRRNDADITLQTLYAMNQFLLFESTQEAFICLFEKVANHILELSQDGNKAIVTMADHVIDAICELDRSRGDQIRSMRFDMYNSGWSETLEVLSGL